jgi:hypothetical protein
MSSKDQHQKKEPSGPLYVDEDTMEGRAVSGGGSQNQKSDSGSEMAPGSVPGVASARSRSPVGEKQRATLGKMDIKARVGSSSQTGRTDEKQRIKSSHDEGLRMAPGSVAVAGIDNKNNKSDNHKLRMAPAVEPTSGRNSRDHHLPDNDDADDFVTRPGAIRIGDRKTSDGSSGLSHEVSPEQQTPPSPKVFTVEAMLVEHGSVTNEDRQRIEQEIRNEVLNETVVGEAIIEEPNGNNSKKFLIIGVAVVVLLVGAIVGIVLGTRKPLVLEKTPSPSLSLRPSTSPTGRPTSSPRPTVTPSLTPSVQPSSGPTVSNANLDNRDFEEAHFLALGLPPLDNLISNVAPQGFSIDCGPLAQSQTPGLWYTYRAKTSGPVSVITCGPTRVEAYTYYYNFECLLSDFSSGDIGNCGGSSLSWAAVYG